MSSDIFVNRDGLIEAYLVDIDERKLEKIQTAIDKWNERNIKTNNCVNDGQKKTEVIFKRFNEDGSIGFYNPIENVYSVHPLSSLCSFILFDYNAFDLSEHLKCLVEWETPNLEEMDFVRQILSTMRFEKIDTKYLRNGRAKIKLGLASLNKMVDDKIKEMGFFDSSFYAKMESQEYFGKSRVRKKVLSSLPLAHYFE